MATYYVRTDGADTNDGSANDAAHAWLTNDKALGTTGIALTGGPHTLNIGAGTYAESSGGAGYLKLQRAYGTLTTVQPTSGSNDVTITGNGTTAYNVRQSAAIANVLFSKLTFASSGSTNRYALCFGSGSGWTATGVEFRDCVFTSSATGGTGPLGRCVHMESGSSNPAIAAVFTRCTMTCSVASEPAIQIYDKGQTGNFTFDSCTVSGQGKGADLGGIGTYTIIDGSYSGGTSHGLQLGVDNVSGADITGSISAGTLCSSGATHALLIGAGVHDFSVDKARIKAGDLGLVLKKCLRVSVTNCDVLGGTGSAVVLLKGCQYTTVQSCNIRAVGTGQYCIKNSDNAGASYYGDHSAIIHNVLWAEGPASVYYWVPDYDTAGTSVIDGNLLQVIGTGNFGTVWNSAGVTTLAGVKAAWASYGDGSNDGKSFIVLPTLADRNRVQAGFNRGDDVNGTMPGPSIGAGGGGIQ